MESPLPETFAIEGELVINRLGYGAMRLTGPGIIGEPRDREGAKRALAAIPDLGINFIDTADSYGPNVSENLIREVLHPYDGLVIATKGGFTRPGPNQWQIRGDPEYLRAAALASRERLGVEAIDLWQLHRIDPLVSRDAQFEAVRSLLDDGIIRHAGLSEVSVADIEEASAYFPVATVQNRYNLVDRGSEGVLAFAEQHGIGFIPWFPLAAGDLLRSQSVLDRIAMAHDATAGQIAIAWLLRRSPVMIPIPGTSNVNHLRENAAAARIRLSDQEFEALDRAGRA
ncbi:MAG: aldo/keto reductase [Bradyrhizobium sp.]|nr:aldo/keto reductase [Bradyrhizobium sp.]